MRRQWVPLLLAAGLAWLACTGGGGEGSTPEGGAKRTELSVFAAASLTEAAREAARAYEARTPGVAVVLNLAGSQQLAAQILAGAPAHVFLSADPVQVERLVDGGRVQGRAVLFARNALSVVTPPGNPAGIASFRDLGRPGPTLVIGAPAVPVGRYTRRAARRAGIELKPASLEADVKQVLAKVLLGEADAGVVYRTDAAAAGDRVHEISVPRSLSGAARYEAAVVADGRAGEEARRFLRFLVRGEGRRTLASHGFLPAGTEGP